MNTYELSYFDVTDNEQKRFEFQAEDFHKALNKVTMNGKYPRIGEFYIEGHEIKGVCLVQFTSSKHDATTLTSVGKPIIGNMGIYMSNKERIKEIK